MAAGLAHSGSKDSGCGGRKKPCLLQSAFFSNFIYLLNLFVCLFIPEHFSVLASGGTVGSERGTSESQAGKYFA